MQKDISSVAPVCEWTEFLAAHPDITALDAFIIDVNGNAVGKRVQVEDAETVFTDGVQFSACALIADSRGLGHNIQGMGGSDGDPRRRGAAHPGQSLRGSMDASPGGTGDVSHARCQVSTFLLVRSTRHSGGRGEPMPRRRTSSRGCLRAGVLSDRPAASRRRLRGAGRVPHRIPDRRAAPQIYRWTPSK